MTQSQQRRSNLDSISQRAGNARGHREHVDALLFVALELERGHIVALHIKTSAEHRMTAESRAGSQLTATCVMRGRLPGVQLSPLP